MSRLVEFAQFFETTVPARFFLMFEAPPLARTYYTPEFAGCIGGDLVQWMRIFLCDDALYPEFIDVPTELGLDALTYYNLVLGRGRHKGSEFKLLLPRFDRFPPESRKEIATGVLVRLIAEGTTPWYEETRNRLGQNAASAVTEWCPTRA